MDSFNFLSVMFSVVIGLALTEILQGFRLLILARKRVTVYWPALAWAVLMILLISQAWWGMFAMHDLSRWTFAMYIVVVLQITLMYLAAGVAMPEVPEEGPVDMGAAYFANKTWFFSLLAVTVIATFAKDYVIGGRIESAPNLLILLYYFVLAGIASLTASRWFHYALAPAVLLGLVLNAAFLSYRL